MANIIASPQKQKTSKLKTIVVAVAISSVVVCLTALVAVQLAYIIESVNRPDSIYTHRAYFVPESTKANTKYALIDQDGNELTGYTIEKYSPFIDGYALIKNSDGWGIISDTGKMSVKPNKYDGISRVGGLYTVFKTGESTRSLIRGSGRKVTRYDSSLNLKLGSSSGEYSNKEAVVTAIKRDDSTFDLFDARGHKVETIKSQDDPVVSSVMYSKDNQNGVTTISYSGGIIVISNSNLQVAAKIVTGNDKLYAVDSTSMDSQQLIFTEIEKQQGTRDEVKDEAQIQTFYSENHAIYTGSVFKDVGKNCRSMALESDELTPRGYISCYSDDGAGFYDKDGIFHMIRNPNTLERSIIIDNGHYAYYNPSQNLATINGKKYSNISNIEIAGANFVLISDYRQTIYDKNGDKICTLSKDVTDVEGFDSNNLAIVGALGVIGQRYSYLMDGKCGAVSSRYLDIEKFGDYYAVSQRKSNGIDSYLEYALIDKKGKIRIRFGEYQDYRQASSRGQRAQKLILAEKSDETMVLFNEKLENVAEFKGSASYDGTQDFFIVQDEKFMSYYTLDGVQLHSVPLGDGARSRT